MYLPALLGNHDIPTDRPTDRTAEQQTDMRGNRQVTLPQKCFLFFNLLHTRNLQFSVDFECLAPCLRPLVPVYGIEKYSGK